jgi:uncharacterized protein YdiU (UPF0061 family)
MMGQKLGLDKVSEEDISLIDEFEKTLAEIKPDMTLFFHLLGTLSGKTDNPPGILEHFNESFYNVPDAAQSSNLVALINKYESRLKINTCTSEESADMMKTANPRFILRNYLLHQAIEELEQGKNNLFVKLQEAIKSPYQTVDNELMQKRPDWAGQKAGCSMLSCSS